MSKRSVRLPVSRFVQSSSWLKGLTFLKIRRRLRLRQLIGPRVENALDCRTHNDEAVLLVMVHERELLLKPGSGVSNHTRLGCFYALLDVFVDPNLNLSEVDCLTTEKSEAQYRSSIIREIGEVSKIRVTGH
jgi:hypothetical protein